jgi:thiamine biosynthesis lipoprotein
LVKGWAVERAAGILEQWGAANFCINAGGDIVLRGGPQPGQPWRVGVRHPEHDDLLAVVLAASGPLAVATSALYERGRHIVDPRTGEAAEAWASVTIVGPDLTFADAFATTVFVLGLDGLDWLFGHPGYEGFAITPDALTYSTPGFGAYRG